MKKFIISGVLSVALFFGLSAQALPIPSIKFDVLPASIPSTASTIRINFNVQADPTTDCNGATVGQGRIGWVVWYDASAGIPIVVRRGTSVLPLSPNPIILDFNEKDFIPDGKAVNAGSTQFRAAVGCDEAFPYANSQGNLAVSSAVPITITRGGGGQVTIDNFSIVQSIINAGSAVDFRFKVMQRDFDLDCSAMPGVGSLEWVIWYDTKIGPVVVRRQSVPLRLSPNPKPLDFTIDKFEISQYAAEQTSLSFRAATGCSASTNVTDSGNIAVSEPVLVKIGSVIPPGTCGIISFGITPTGNNKYSYKLTTSPECNSRLASIQLYTQDAKGGQIPGDVLANGPIQGGIFTGSVDVSVPTLKFFLRSSVAGDGTKDSIIFDPSDNGKCGGAGQPACPPGTKYSCNSNNQCVVDASGTYTNSNCDYKCIGATAPKSYIFNITNPLKGGPNDLFDIINIVTKWIMLIAIPLAVLYIMYAGFLMLTAGPTPANFQKGRDILKYVVIGLAIIFIGKGFVTLIISVIELGGTPPPATQPLPPPPPPQPPPIPPGTIMYGCFQGYCIGNADPSVYEDFTELSTNPICPNTSCAGTGTNGSQPGSSCSNSALCLYGMTCKNSMCQLEAGNFVNEPCVKNNNCRNGATCDMTKKQIIDSQERGTCVAPAN